MHSNGMFYYNRLRFGGEGGRAMDMSFSADILLLSLLLFRCIIPHSFSVLTERRTFFGLREFSFSVLSERERPD